MSMNEGVTEILRSFLPPPLAIRVRGVVVVVGSCVGTESGISASPPSYPIFPLSLYVVNECIKILMAAFCWKRT